jgi:hypothetical protein
MVLDWNKLVQTTSYLPDTSTISQLAYTLNYALQKKPKDSQDAEDFRTHIRGVFRIKTFQTLVKNAVRLESRLTRVRLKGIFETLNRRKGPNFSEDFFGQCETALRQLEDLLMPFYKLVQGEEEKVTLSVQTTPLLTCRFWTEILHGFYDSEESQGVRVILDAAEPQNVVHNALHGSAHHLFLTYSTQAMLALIKEANSLHSWSTTLHRCLLAPLGALKDVNEFKLDLLHNRRLAVINNRGSVFPNFPWDRVLPHAAVVETLRTTLDTHAFVINRCGLTISHLEMRDELEQKGTDAIELPQDYGEAFLILAQPRELTGDDRQKNAIKKLVALVQDRFSRMETNYKRSRTLTQQLARLPYSYHTRLYDAGSHTYDWWRGQVSIQVTTPGLFVRGDLSIRPDKDMPERKAPRSLYRLFGRIVPFSGSEGTSVMTLRAMEEVTSSPEVSMASFLFTEVPGADPVLRCPAFAEVPCIIGHWIGWSENEGRPGTNGGTWIWHERPDLTPKELQKLLQRHHATNPLNLCPGLTPPKGTKPAKVKVCGPFGTLSD